MGEGEIGGDQHRCGLTEDDLTEEAFADDDDEDD